MLTHCNILLIVQQLLIVCVPDLLTSQWTQFGDSCCQSEAELYNFFGGQGWSAWPLWGTFSPLEILYTKRCRRKCKNFILSFGWSAHFSYHSSLHPDLTIWQSDRRHIWSSLEGVRRISEIGQLGFLKNHCRVPGDPKSAIFATFEFYRFPHWHECFRWHECSKCQRGLTISAVLWGQYFFTQNS